jgi:hypothetical protein
VCSITIIWPVLAEHHHLFVWRVRIFFKLIHARHDFGSAGMHRTDQKCSDLIEVTANALSGGVVALMLMAVQRDNLELSVKQAIEW